MSKTTVIHPDQVVTAETADSLSRQLKDLPAGKSLDVCFFEDGHVVEYTLTKNRK